MVINPGSDSYKNRLSRKRTGVHEGYIVNDSDRYKCERKRGDSITRQCDRLQEPFSLEKRNVRERETALRVRDRLIGVQIPVTPLCFSFQKRKVSCKRKLFLKGDKMEDSESTNNREAQERGIELVIKTSFPWRH